MDADLSSMHKGPTALAKWQCLQPLVQKVSRLEFMQVIRDGRQLWKLEDYKTELLQDGREIVFAQISMRIGNFGFAFYTSEEDMVLVDFHLNYHELGDVGVQHQAVN